MNRHEKSGKDAAEWVPDRNRCWFADRVLEVRRAYGLTIDWREAAVLDGILAGCESMALEPVVCAVPSASVSEPASSPAAGDDALARYDDNRNGRITCKEARGHGSHRLRVPIRRIGTCATRTGMGSCASSPLT